MTLRWTLPLLSPFDFKHPNNSYTLVLGQILISDLWGTATLSFSCSLFSIRVVRSWSLRLRWDFLSSSAWCFQFCFIHSGHPVNTNWNDFKQKPELGGSEPAPNETPCSSLPSSYRLNGVAWGTTTFPTASCGPIQPDSTFPCCTIPRKKGQDGMGFIWDISCIRYCTGSQTLRF